MIQPFGQPFGIDQGHGLDGIAGCDGCAGSDDFQPVRIPGGVADDQGQLTIIADPEMFGFGGGQLIKGSGYIDQPGPGVLISAG